MHRSTLEQWYILQTVIDVGGFTAAAKQVHRSQSSVSYAIKNLQQQLDVELLRIHGKKVQLTPLGATLLEDVRPLLKEFANIELRAKLLTAGAPANIKLEVDSIYPKSLLFRALSAFKQTFPHTQVELKEIVRLAPTNSLANCDLSIGLPFNGKLMAQKLLDVELVAVAHPAHPLHHLKKTRLTEADLNHYIQVHLDNNHQYASATIERSSQRWTVNTVDAAIEAVRSNLCFGWLPAHRIEDLINQGELTPLPLDMGRVRSIPLYLIYMDYDRRNPAIQALAELICEV
ncbi:MULTISPECIES: LysR family transcriptional regulator [unclassified Agarivorans]|uniref:LysR family transcriptional regulator n=1 Tax=unclassified Agarivorans TaxID=2636026 RepID=UPI003D7D7054